jgi:FkbM family methyltransferase
MTSTMVCNPSAFAVKISASSVVMTVSLLLLLSHIGLNAPRNCVQPLHFRDRSVFSRVVEKWEDMDARLRKNRDVALNVTVEVDLRYKFWTKSIMGIHFVDMMEDISSVAGKFVTDELNNDVYHLQELKSIVRAGDVILDLGTNIGLTAILIAKLMPNVRIIGVEASPFNWIAAERNIRKMGVQDRVTILHAALCKDTTSTVMLRQNRDNAGASTAVYGIGNKMTSSNEILVEIQCITVDEIVQRYNVTETPFVKLDCEGCEYFVVPGLSPATRAMLLRSHVVGETHSQFQAAWPKFKELLEDVPQRNIELGNSIFHEGSITQRTRPKWRALEAQFSILTRHRSEKN